MINDLIIRNTHDKNRVVHANANTVGPFWGHATVWDDFNTSGGYVAIQLDSQEERQGTVELRMTPEQAKAFALAILQRVAEQESPS